MALLLTSAAASADTFTYNLTIPNDATALGAGPFGTVEVTTTSSTTATITFSAASGYLFGATDAVDINSLFDLSFSNLGTLTSTGSGNVDGFGTFSYTFSNPDGLGQAQSSFTFNITSNAGTWGSAAGILSPNGSGHSVAAHVFNTALCAGTTPCTGFVTEGGGGSTGGGGATIPEPASLLLFGIGATAAAYRARRRVATR